MSQKLRFEVFKRDDFTCVYCGRGPENGAILEADHIVPRSKGGPTVLGNLVTACWECNAGKGSSPCEKRMTLEDNTRTVWEAGVRVGFLLGLARCRPLRRIDFRYAENFKIQEAREAAGTLTNWEKNPRAADWVRSCEIEQLTLGHRGPCKAVVGDAALAEGPADTPPVDWKSYIPDLNPNRSQA